jgi:hypothetical protein
MRMPGSDLADAQAGRLGDRCRQPRCACSQQRVHPGTTHSSDERSAVHATSVEAVACARNPNLPFGFAVRAALTLGSPSFDLVADDPIPPEESRSLVAGGERWQEWRRRQKSAAFLDLLSSTDCTTVIPCSGSHESTPKPARCCWPVSLPPPQL